jgi:hypothetical protein
VAMHKLATNGKKILMKILFSKQNVILAILLCIVASCKLTGDFAVVKRQHSNGYYIQTPSFVKKSDIKTTPVAKHTKQPVDVKTVIKPDNDNLIASVNAMPLVETKPQSKTIAQATINFASQYNLRTIA